MSNLQLDDVKRLFEATLSQSESQLRAEMRQGFAEMHAGFAGVADSLESISDLIDRDYKQTKRRLTRLEQRSA